MYEKTYRRLLFLILSGVVCLIYASLQVKTGEEQDKTVISKSDITDVSPSLAVEEKKDLLVYPSGEPIGIYVKTDGVMVIGVTAVQGEGGERLSPCQGKIMQGDYIVAIDGQCISSKREMIEAVQKCDGEAIQVTIRRDREKLTKNIEPVLGVNQNYLIGLWVKDDISGIGTMTYETEEEFAALGHSINDNDTGELFHISDGAIYKADIFNIRKPVEGVPGRLEGVIDYAGDNMVGRVENNEEYGIQGKLLAAEQKHSYNLSATDWVQVAEKSELHTGTAYLLSAITGERRLYEVQIVSLDFDRKDSKGIELKVLDEDLIELTGGIVQGMSGTPILQDGKLIGAVTHVFVHDSTKGYGIYIGEMLE